MKATERILILSILISAFATGGCSKEDDVEMRTFRVLDSATGSPIPGAVLDYYEEAGSCCGESFGVREVGTFHADENGLAQFPVRNNRGYQVIVVADGYYNLSWNNIYRNMSFVVHDLNYHEPFHDGPETEIIMFPRASMAINLRINPDEPNPVKVILQGCYLQDQNAFYCFERTEPPTDLLGNSIDTYSYPDYGIVPIGNDSTLSRPVIGDLSIQLEVLYLDENSKLIKTQNVGVYGTPRNTETEITIQL